VGELEAKSPAKAGLFFILDCALELPEKVLVRTGPQAVPGCRQGLFICSL